MYAIIKMTYVSRITCIEIYHLIEITMEQHTILYYQCDFSDSFKEMCVLMCNSPLTGLVG